MRTIVEIPNNQIKALSKISDKSKLSRAELIRRAIAEYLKQQSDDSSKAFGIWKDKHIDGLKYQKDLRQEWSD